MAIPNTTLNDKSPSSSEIVNFYDNKCIFITGASGFIGKVLVEKLLRTCPNLSKIYMLLRSKKVKKDKKDKKEEKIITPQERLEQEFTECKLYEHLDKKLIRSKLVALDGDLTSNRLGLTNEGLNELCSKVNIVFHVAASVRFDDPLKECVRYNVLGTKTVLDLCHQMINLDCFLHVSTAYAYCHMKRSEECLYPLKASASQVIEACNWMDERTLKQCSELLMEDRPNTYTFTKAVAEHYINENRGNLPVAIARPSIVTASLNEPFAGWIDSINGPGGASLLGTLGIARTMNCKPNYTADLIPIDIVTNAVIVIAWKTAIEFKHKQLENNNNVCSPTLAKADSHSSSTTLPIYNITSGDVNPTTWEEFLEYGREVAFSMPSEKMVRLPATAPKGDKVNWYAHMATKIFSETLFAYFADLIMIVIGKDPIMVRLVRRMHNAFSLLEYFANRQWSFPCDNLLSLYDSLSETDKKLFDFDIRKVDWRTYTHNFYVGIRRHLMKEDDDNVPKALKHMQRLKIGYAFVNTISLVLLIWFLLWLFPVQNNYLCTHSTVKYFTS